MGIIRQESTFNLAMILTFDLILRSFSAISTHMMTICSKFQWNPSTTYRDIALLETGK